MIHDPHEAEEAAKTPVSSRTESESRPRFRIEKLEERIAPHFGGRHCSDFKNPPVMVCGA